MPGTATTILIDGTPTDDRIVFDVEPKSPYSDAEGLGGVDAISFVTTDTLKGELDHTDFLHRVWHEVAIATQSGS